MLSLSLRFDWHSDLSLLEGSWCIDNEWMIYQLFGIQSILSFPLQQAFYHGLAVLRNFDTSLRLDVAKLNVIHFQIKSTRDHLVQNDSDSPLVYFLCKIFDLAIHHLKNLRTLVTPCAKCSVHFLIGHNDSSQAKVDYLKSAIFQNHGVFRL